MKALKKRRKSEKERKLPAILTPTSRHLLSPTQTPSGALPVEEYAPYSIASGFTKSGSILGGTVDFLRAVPIEPQYRQGFEEKVTELQREISEMKEDFGRRIGRVERAWGDLVPKIVAEYYGELGYEAAETNVQVDQTYKIDVIAVGQNEVNAVSVKKGQVAPQEILQIAKKGSVYLDESYSRYEEKRVVIVASRFPENFLEIRDELREEGVGLQYLMPNHIVRRLPRYEYVFYE